MMQLYQPWLREIRAWAKLNGNIREVWLFGSRARGSAKPRSDVDLAIALTPRAFGNYIALGDQWQG